MQLKSADEFVIWVSGYLAAVDPVTKECTQMREKILAQVEQLRKPVYVPPADFPKIYRADQLAAGGVSIAYASAAAAVGQAEVKTDAAIAKITRDLESRYGEDFSQ